MLTSQPALREEQYLTLLPRVELMMRTLARTGRNNVSPVEGAVFHHFRAPGKQMRARLGLWAASALQLHSDCAVAIAASSELIHNASLVHDDIQDGDEQRRGQPSVWHAFGQGTAISVGDLLLSAAYAALAQASSLAAFDDLLATTHRCVATTIKGQTADLVLRDKPMADMAAYERVAGDKTGPLLSLPLELALIAAGRKQYLGLAERATRSFGTAYQILDDLEDHGNTNGAPQFNIVHVLHQSGITEDIAGLAKNRAHLLLAQTVSAAEELPSGCGLLLAEFARKLQLGI